ncbi:MAG: adenylate/guanylate cyclase domain-containing protein [Bacteroidota bacterium]
MLGIFKNTLSVISLICLSAQFCIGQPPATDSLQSALKNAGHDTTRCSILLAWGERIYAQQPEAAIKFWEQSNALAEQNLVKYPSYHPLYRAFKMQSAAALNDIAAVYDSQGDIPKALDFYQKGLKISEEVDDKSTTAGILNNIGFIYKNQGYHVKALEYFQKSLSISDEIGSNPAINIPILNNIGDIYRIQQQNDEAFRYYENSLHLAESIGDKAGMSSPLHNIGLLYEAKKDYNKALDFYQKSLKIDEDLGDKAGISFTLNSIASIYFSRGQFAEALTFAERSLQIARELGYPENIRNAAYLLKRIYQQQQDFPRALQMYEMYTQMRDSINNTETKRASIKNQLQYQYEKKVTADSIRMAEERKVIDARFAQEQTQRYALMGVLGLSLVFAGFMFSRYQITRRQKKVIQSQHAELTQEKKKSDDLLLNILPLETAEELKTTGRSVAKSYAEVTVLFTDFKDFSKIAEALSAEDLVHEINYFYSAFDRIIAQYDIEKIKTIGDSYMCAAGLPVPNKTHAEDLVRAALDIQAFMRAHTQEQPVPEHPPFELRIGIHTGPVVAGIVGINKFAYDIWGNTVNIASRMETSGEAGKVNISERTYELVKDKFSCAYRGKIEAKHAGMIDMYFVE